MKLEEIKKILDLAFETNPSEIGCDDCEERMDEYATYVIQEKELDETLNVIKEHIDICNSCNEEFQSLLLAINSSNIS